MKIRVVTNGANYKVEKLTVDGWELRYAEQTFEAAMRAYLHVKNNILDTYHTVIEEDVAPE